ncbi:MAG: hypothetical protein AB1489_04540 [Acidobacteriota bacterium]
MKIDRFNLPDFNSLNEARNTSNETPARADFNNRLESPSLPTASPTASPLQKSLTGIAKASDMNNSIMSRVAIDQATRAIISGLINPELKDKIDLEQMFSAISDFAQNDPVLSQRLRNLLTRLA